MSLLSKALKLAHADPALGRRLHPFIRKAFSLPDLHLWAKDILYVAKADEIEWLPKVEAKTRGAMATVTVPFRYRKAGSRKWQEGNAMMVVQTTPGTFGPSDHEGPIIKVMVGGL